MATLTLVPDFSDPILTDNDDSKNELLVGDFDGDGYQDDVIFAGGSSVSLLIGDGTGHFTPGNSYSVPNYAQDVAVGDFNGDNLDDLAVVSNTYLNSTTVSLLLGDGAGKFTAGTSVTTDGRAFDLVIADFNGDGFDDLALAKNTYRLETDYYGYDYYAFNGSKASILLGDGAGNFGAATDFDVANFPSDLTTGDFNGDEVTDLVTVNFNSVSVLLGNGDGTFAAATDYGLDYYFGRTVAVADLNGDGFDDLVTQSTEQVYYYGYYYYFPRTVSVLLADGLGGFAPAVEFETGYYPRDIAIGDIDQDGNLDIVTANNFATISLLLGDSTGNFDDGGTFDGGFYGQNNIGLGDFDNNGKLDVVTGSYDGLSVFLYEPYNLITGTGGKDELIGTNTKDVIKGLIGNDTLYGLEGNDELYGGGDRDWLHGGNGNDLLNGGFGNDKLYGDAGNDTLFDYYGDNTLSGGDGNDALYSGDGKDILNGGTGDDYLDGGYGNDILTGGIGNDTLSDYSGNNTLSGGAGNDSLNSGDGADNLSGGTGNDVLDGGYGNDILTGGGDADIFVINYSGSDTIRDFEDGIDKLKYYGSFSYIYIEQKGNSTIIFNENEILATLLGTSASNITSDDFIV